MTRGTILALPGVLVLIGLVAILASEIQRAKDVAVMERLRAEYRAGQAIDDDLLNQCILGRPIQFPEDTTERSL
jgi:hypothetical protein